MKRTADDLPKEPVFLRTFFLQACWNFQRMQGLGFAYCLRPWLERIYEGPALTEALRRHQEYFNTQPYMASWALGMVGALERDAARSPAGQRAEKQREILALKKTAASALAGIGDSFFWGSLRPFCAALALALGMAAWFFGAGLRAVGLGGAAVYAAVYNGPALWARWKGLGLGLNGGRNIAQSLGCFPWQTWIARLRIYGTFLATGILAGAFCLSLFSGGPAVLGLAIFIAALGAFRRWPVFTSPALLYGLVCLAGAAVTLGRHL